MRVLSRIGLGSPELRKRAKKVSAAYVRSKEFSALERDLIYTMRRIGGVGLAAPQVGIHLQIAVLETRPTPLRPKLSRKGPLTLINPRIVATEGKPILGWEGCFSVLMFGKVARSARITVEYMTSEGERVREKASGLWARILQHEIDHLNGVLFVDRMNGMKTLMSPREYRKSIRPKV